MASHVPVVPMDRGNNTTCTINLHGATIVSWRVNNQVAANRLVKRRSLPLPAGKQHRFPLANRQLYFYKEGRMRESIKGLVKKALYWQFENYLAERGGGQTDCLGRVQLLYLYQTSEEGGGGRPY